MLGRSFPADCILLERYNTDRTQHFPPVVTNHGRRREINLRSKSAPTPSGWPGVHPWPGSWHTSPLRHGEKDLLPAPRESLPQVSEAVPSTLCRDPLAEAVSQGEEQASLCLRSQRTFCAWCPQASAGLGRVHVVQREWWKKEGASQALLPMLVLSLSTDWNKFLKRPESRDQTNRSPRFQSRPFTVRLEKQAFCRRIFFPVHEVCISLCSFSRLLCSRIAWTWWPKYLSGYRSWSFKALEPRSTWRTQLPPSWSSHQAALPTGTNSTSVSRETHNYYSAYA